LWSPAALATLALLLVPSSAAWGQWYGPGWGWGPYYAPYYYAPPITGDVKLDGVDKHAEVFVDGAYAGKAGGSKRLHLKPGTYQIQVRSGGRVILNQQVYVVAGKSVHLHPQI
jgi:hypothetical protein